MPTTNHYGLSYLAPGEPLYQARDHLEDNAWTTEAALKRLQAYVNQLVTILPAGQGLIGLDTDGVPYVDRSGTVSNPVAVGLDTDGVPYVVRFYDPEGI